MPRSLPIKGAPECQCQSDKGTKRTDIWPSPKQGLAKVALTDAVCNRSCHSTSWAADGVGDPREKEWMMKSKIFKSYTPGSIKKVNLKLFAATNSIWSACLTYSVKLFIRSHHWWVRRCWWFFMWVWSLAVNLLQETFYSLLEILQNIQ